MSVSIERATPADVETLVQVQIAAFHDDARIYPGVSLGGPPGYDSEEEMLDMITSYDYYKMVADGQIVGGVMVIDKGEGHMHLAVLYIAPAFHNRGIGTQTIEFVERTYPAKIWSLDTPDYATRNHHFYEKFGYVRVGSEPVEDFNLLAYEKQF